MIRFPERFHASVTPGSHIVGVEPNYREQRSRAHGNQASRVSANAKHGRPVFDFAALLAAMGH